MRVRQDKGLDDAIAEVSKDWAEKMMTGPFGRYEFKDEASVLANINKLPITDRAVGEWVAGETENLFTYIPTGKTTGKWYYWNGAFHQEDYRGLTADSLAVAFADALWEVMTAVMVEINTSGEMSHDQKQKCFKHIKNMIKFAETVMSERGLSALRKRIQLACTQAPTYFDNDQRWIVFKDGKVIDQMGSMDEILDPDPKRPVSKTLGIIHTGQKDKPARWLNALNAWVPDKQIQKMLQVAAGAALSGRGDAKAIIVLVGVSNTGKSTYINILKEIFGDGEHGYAGVLPATAIVQKYGGATNFEQYKARGKRFLYLSEPQTTKTDDAFLKNLSGGGETVTTAEKGQNTVDWRAQCVLHIAANHIPRFDTHDRAVVDRMNLVGFDHVFKNTNQGSAGDFALELVEHEGGSILNWILEGLVMYEKLGYIPVPDSIKKKAESNVIDSSAPLRWLEEVVQDEQYVIDTGAFMKDMVEPKDAFKEFAEWCFENSERVVSKKIWLSEIEKFNNMPADKRGARSGGKARVWGLVKIGTHIERQASYVTGDKPVEGAKSGQVKYSDLVGK